MLRRLRSWWRTVVHRAAFEDAMRDEMQFHVESRAADLVRRGVPPAEAARQARLEFGSVEKHKAVARERVGLRVLDDTAADVRYAIRTFRQNKAFTAAAVATLALGIGANTAIFSLVDALMLRWLPVRNPQELVQLKMQEPGSSPAEESLSYPVVHALDAQHELFAGVAGFSGFVFTVGAPGALTRVPGALVTGSYYGALGLAPVIGRLLDDADDQPGAAAVAVLSYGYWERQFARSPLVLGRAILLNGVAATVVGVSPPGFAGANVGTVADVTMPVASVPVVLPSAAPLLQSGNFWLRVLARPQRGVSPAELRDRLTAWWRHASPGLIPPHWPASRRREMAESTFVIAPGGTGWTYLRSMYDKPLRILMGAVTLVLLIACANLASLLLARASARRREIAVRLAMGAARARIVRQLLVESVLLSAMGAVAGVFLAWISSRTLLGILSSGRQSVVFDLTPNWHVLVFTAATALATVILFGVVPALQATAFRPGPVLKDEARTTSARGRLLPALVSAQVALSLVLLIGAGLLVRTLENLQTLDAGFRPDGVLLVDFEGRRTALPPSLVDEVLRLPGVVAASVSTHTPLNGSIWSEPAVAAGTPLPDRDTAFFVGAGPGFFSALGIPLLAGRQFTPHDAAGAPAVAIVNERYAATFLNGTNPIGRHLSATVRGERRDLEVIGLAANTRAAGLRKPAPPTVYVAYAQLTGDFPTTLEVRAAGSLNAPSAELRQLLQSRFPDMPLAVRPFSTQVRETMVQERMMATLASSFGIVALVLASVGVYGLLAYGIARRTHEIGIRMALGAQRRGVIALVLGAARTPLLTGVGIGLLAAWGATRWIESMLFGLTRTDPTSIATACVVLIGVAHVAAWLPARRAARLDPIIALRHE